MPCSSTSGGPLPASKAWQRTPFSTTWRCSTRTPSHTRSGGVARGQRRELATCDGHPDRVLAGPVPLVEAREVLDVDVGRQVGSQPDVRRMRGDRHLDESRLGVSRPWGLRQTETQPLLRHQPPATQGGRAGDRQSRRRTPRSARRRSCPVGNCSSARWPKASMRPITSAASSVDPESGVSTLRTFTAPVARAGPWRARAAPPSPPASRVRAGRTRPAARRRPAPPASRAGCSATSRGAGRSGRGAAPR